MQCEYDKYRMMPIALLVLLVMLWRSAPVTVAHNAENASGRGSSSSSPVCVVNDGDRSCSYNGVCSLHPNTNMSKTFCQCDAGWTGIYCETLNLAPVHNGSGLQDMLTNDKISTWGGSVLYNQDDGLYHMWFSELRNHCGIHRWVSNSVVSYAVSRGPADGWTFYKQRGTIFPVFSHEPIAVQDPTTGAFGLFVSHYPNGSAADSPICECVDGNTSPASRPECEGEAPLGMNKTMFTYFTTSTKPQGPWGPLMSLEQETPSGQRKTDLNFAPLILSNGSSIAWSRWDIWTAQDWMDPTSYTRQGQAPNFNDPNGNWEGEDPSMWRDHKGRFHIMSHNGDRGTGGTSQEPHGDCGRHLFSETGKAGTWIAAPLPLGGCAYPRVNVSFADGEVRSF